MNPDVSHTFPTQYRLFEDWNRHHNAIKQDKWKGKIKDWLRVACRSIDNCSLRLPKSYYYQREKKAKNLVENTTFHQSFSRYHHKLRFMLLVHLCIHLSCICGNVNIIWYTAVYQKHSRDFQTFDVFYVSASATNHPGNCHITWY